MADSLGLTKDCDGKPIAWGTVNPCTQCNGSCIQDKCFSANCDYVERASSNRMDGGYPNTKLSCNNTTFGKCRNLPDQKCKYRVAPMINAFGEVDYMNKEVPNWSYAKGYDKHMPSWVGNGLRCNYYPIVNNAMFPALTHYTKL